MSDKLLLVDDEPGLREAVQAYLSQSGFTVEVATNGQEGWDKLQQDIPDLVITDIMMPEVDGYQLLKQMREDPRLKAIPVVFLTARGMTSDRIQGYQARCDAYISKPFDPDELVAVVENLLARRSNATEGLEDGETPDIATLARQIQEIKELLTHKSAIPQKSDPVQIDLTPREESVLELVAQGLMNKEIASRLETSVRNVEKYVSRLFSKTGTNEQPHGVGSLCVREWFDGLAVFRKEKVINRPDCDNKKGDRRDIRQRPMTQTQKQEAEDATDIKQTQGSVESQNLGIGGGFSSGFALKQTLIELKGAAAQVIDTCGGDGEVIAIEFSQGIEVERDGEQGRQHQQIASDIERTAGNRQNPQPEGHGGDKDLSQDPGGHHLNPFPAGETVGVAGVGVRGGK